MYVIIILWYISSIFQAYFKYRSTATGNEASLLMLLKVGCARRLPDVIGRTAIDLGIYLYLKYLYLKGFSNRVYISLKGVYICL